MVNECPTLAVLSEELSEASEARLQQLAGRVYKFGLEAYQNNDLSLTKETCLKALAMLNQVSGVLKEKALLGKTLANVYQRQGESREALEHNLASAEQLAAIGETKEAISCYGNCGIILHCLGDLAGAYKKHLLALDLSEKNGFKDEQARALVNISIIFTERKEFSDALLKMRQAKSIFEKLGDKKGLSYVLNAMADTKEALVNPEASLPYRRKALIIREEIGDERGILLSYNSFSEALIKTGNPEEAEVLCRKALIIAVEDHWLCLRAIVLTTLAEALLDQCRTQEAMQICEEANKLYNMFEGYLEFKARSKSLEARSFHELGKHLDAYQTHLEYTKLRENYLVECKSR